MESRRRSRRALPSPMPPMPTPRHLLPLLLLAAACTAARPDVPATRADTAAAEAATAHDAGDHAAHHAATAAAPAATSDSAFAALQTRGASARGMGVDQYTSTHAFESLPDGGRIELQRDPRDSVGVARIRAHLQEIARAFAAGDFSTPAFVHERPVPGTDVMAARRAAIAYVVRPLPGGGEVRITTADPEAVRAVHAFLAFQRADHRAH